MPCEQARDPGHVSIYVGPLIAAPGYPGFVAGFGFPWWKDFGSNHALPCVQQFLLHRAAWCEICVMNVLVYVVRLAVGQTRKSDEIGVSQNHRGLPTWWFSHWCPFRTLRGYPERRHTHTHTHAHVVLSLPLACKGRVPFTPFAVSIVPRFKSEGPFWCGWVANRVTAKCPPKAFGASGFELGSPHIYVMAAHFPKTLVAG